MIPKRELTISEAEQLRWLIGNAHDQAVLDMTKCQQYLREALAILAEAGWPFGPTGAAGGARRHPSAADHVR